jgi:hypothetical protein
MSSFTVFGPFVIPVIKKANGRIIGNIDKFWNDTSTQRKMIGCYVFVMRSAKGYMPCYVGKATKSFEQECFASHKLVKYHEALVSWRKGTPVMFFISQTRRRGPVNEKEIKQVEAYLTQVALAKNAELLNIQNTKQEQWSIQGIARGKQGKASKETRELKRALNL